MVHHISHLSRQMLEIVSLLCYLPSPQKRCKPGFTPPKRQLPSKRERLPKKVGCVLMTCSRVNTLVSKKLPWDALWQFAQEVKELDVEVWCWMQGHILRKQHRRQLIVRLGSRVIALVDTRAVSMPPARSLLLRYFQWPSIVTRPEHTCALIMLFNQPPDMPHLSTVFH